MRASFGAPLSSLELESALESVLESVWEKMKFGDFFSTQVSTCLRWERLVTGETAALLHPKHNRGEAGAGFALNGVWRHEPLRAAGLHSSCAAMHSFGVRWHFLGSFYDPWCNFTPREMQPHTVRMWGISHKMVLKFLLSNARLSNAWVPHN